MMIFYLFMLSYLFFSLFFNLWIHVIDNNGIICLNKFAYKLSIIIQNYGFFIFYFSLYSYLLRGFSFKCNGVYH